LNARPNDSDVGGFVYVVFETIPASLEDQISSLSLAEIKRESFEDSSGEDEED
jgi:hypothetical protein